MQTHNLARTGTYIERCTSPASSFVHFQRHLSLIGHTRFTLPAMEAKEGVSQCKPRLQPKRAILHRLEGSRSKSLTQYQIGSEIGESEFIDLNVSVKIGKQGIGWAVGMNLTITLRASHQRNAHSILRLIVLLIEISFLQSSRSPYILQPVTDA